MSKLIELDPSVSYTSYRVYVEYYSRLAAGEAVDTQTLAQLCGFTYSQIEEALADLRKRAYLAPETDSEAALEMNAALCSDRD